MRLWKEGDCSLVWDEKKRRCPSLRDREGSNQYGYKQIIIILMNRDISKSPRYAET